MRTPDIVPITPELQRARSLLAELCARALVPNRDVHMNVLRAFDNLERWSIGFWPPPPAHAEITAPLVALVDVGNALDQVLSEIETHHVQALPVAFARDFVAQAIERLS